MGFGLHGNGCKAVASDLCWGGCRSAKHCVFSCKVHEGGDDGYLVCAAGAGSLISMFFWFLHAVAQRAVANHIVMAA